jgi:hypothetical protein
MLMYERVAIGTGSTSGISHPERRRLIETRPSAGPHRRPGAAPGPHALYSEETTKSLVAMRTRAELKAGKAPGPGGSLGKLHGAKISAR